MTVWDGEHCINTLATDPGDGIIVAKRIRTCATHLNQDTAGFRDVWIIDILRDPRDVVTSEVDGRFYCDFSRWRRDVLTRQQLAGRHLRLLQLRYEELVADPNQAQRDLADMLGLSVDRPFTAFPAMVPADLSHTSVDDLSGVRAIDSRGIGRWASDPRRRERVDAQLRHYPVMEPMLRWAGYPPTHGLHDEYERSLRSLGDEEAQETRVGTDRQRDLNSAQ
ncbi:MAG: hypothetical protein ACRDYA_12390 [Egibacteraceae bacterium]